MIVEWVLFSLALVLMLTLLPGSIELLLLTVAGILPQRRLPPEEKLPESKADSSALKVAVVVPAHDEECTIGRTVASLNACEDREGMQVVVVADNCSDDTARVAEVAGARVIVRHDRQAEGKGYALNLAFSQLLQEPFDVFVVVDADTVVKPNLITEIRRAFAAGATAVQVRYGVLNPQESLRTRLMSVAFMAMNFLRPRARERLGLSAGIAGNGFALSRRILLDIPFTSFSLVEDLEYHLQLVRRGHRVRFIDATSVCSEIPPRGEGARTQRTRWEGGRLRLLRAMGIGLLRDVLQGRLRLAEPTLELLLLPLALHTTLLLMLLAFPIPLVRAVAVVGLLIVVFHVAAAIAIGGGGIRDFAVLLVVPFYVLWKAGMTASIVRVARGKGKWVRTRRN